MQCQTSNAQILSVRQPRPWNIPSSSFSVIPYSCSSLGRNRHRENTYLTSLQLVSIRRHKIHLECKLCFPSAYIMLLEMHWTILSVSIEAKHWVSWLCWRLPLSLPRVINVKFLLQPQQKYYIPQYGELDSSYLHTVETTIRGWRAQQRTYPRRTSSTASCWSARQTHW